MIPIVSLIYKLVIIYISGETRIVVGWLVGWLGRNLNCWYTHSVLDRPRFTYFSIEFIGGYVVAFLGAEEVLAKVAAMWWRPHHCLVIGLVVM